MNHQITPCLWFDNQAEEAVMRDPAKAGRVTQAYLQMKKFEIEKLMNA